MKSRDFDKSWIRTKVFAMVVIKPNEDAKNRNKETAEAGRYDCIAENEELRLVKMKPSMAYDAYQSPPRRWSPIRPA